MSDSGDLRLPIPLWILVAAVAGLAVILLVGGWLDQRRRTSQLAKIQAEHCTVVLPQGIAKRLRALSGKSHLPRKRAHELVDAVEDLYLNSPSVAILYERGDRVWVVSDRLGPTPNGKARLPQSWRDWAAVTAPGFCEATIEDDSFVVLRSVSSEPGSTIAVMTKQYVGD